MKHVILIMACLILPSLAFAAPADSTAADSVPRNSLRSGAWALQFDVNGQLIRFSSFSGGVSLKRQFSPKSALRFGVGFSGSGSTENPDLAAHPDREATNDRETASIETVYQRYVNADARVNAYWGIGPSARYARDNNENSADSTTNKNTITSWSVGVIGALGAEWFFTRELSLHAEYGVSGWYTKDTQEASGKLGNQTTYSRKAERDGWSGGTSSVRFGMSVYF